MYVGQYVYTYTCKTVSCLHMYMYYYAVPTSISPARFSQQQARRFRTGIKKGVKVTICTYVTMKVENLGCRYVWYIVEYGLRKARSRALQIYIACILQYVRVLIHRLARTDIILTDQERALDPDGGPSLMVSRMRVIAWKPSN